MWNGEPRAHGGGEERGEELTYMELPVRAALVRA